MTPREKVVKTKRLLSLLDEVRMLTIELRTDRLDININNAKATAEDILIRAFGDFGREMYEAGAPP